VSWCEKNFRGIPPGFQLDGQYILNLEALNARLSAINLVFLEEIFPEASSLTFRIPLLHLEGEEVSGDRDLKA